MSQCLDPEQFRRLITEQVSAADRTVLEAHIDVCPSCQEKLERLLEGDEPAAYIDWQRLRRSDPAPTPRSMQDFFRGLKERQPPSSSTGLEAPRASPPQDIVFPDPPTALGRLGRIESYHIVEERGRGAFGVVFQAYDEKLRCPVALKVLKPELAANGRDRARFEGEARKAAAVRHDHVVTIHHVGHTPAFALPYFVMEYIEGEALSERLRRQGPLAAREAAEIARQVALGLDAAHARGLIHRDINPANILLEHDSGRVKITDFGLARTLEVGAEKLTQSGGIVGTPPYMSPEQILTPQRVDPRSDVYSLGVLLYEILTGELPFRGAPHLVLHQVVHEDPRPPRRLNDRIPRDLETICLKALAKEPARRYATAGELAEDLRRFLSGEPIKARPVGAVERLWRWCCRNPVLAGVEAAAALFLALLAFAGWEAFGHLKAQGFCDRLLNATTAEVPGIIAETIPYRRWLDSRLRDAYTHPVVKQDPRKCLHLSLALLPVDPSQVDYLYRRLLNAEPSEVAIVRDALLPHKNALIDRLWAVVEKPENGSQRLRAACLLATYDPDNLRWDKVCAKVVEQVVTENALHLVHWRDGFRPVKNRLLRPLAEVFRDRRTERTAERSLATALLTDYAFDQLEFLAGLLMDADGKQFTVLFPKFKEHGEQGMVLLNAEMERQLRPEWNDPGVSATWREPDPSLVRKIESAQGYWAERFALCQTMPLDDFLAVAEQLRFSGYRPTRFRPYAAGQAVWVAAVWTRDAPDWRIAHNLTAEGLRKRQETHRKEGYQPVDVAAYRADEQDRHAALWIKAPASGPPAHMEIALDQMQFAEKNRSLREEGYLRTAYKIQQQKDGTDRYSAVWVQAKERTFGEEASLEGIEADYSGENYLGDLQVDVQVGQAFQPQGNMNSALPDPRYMAVWHPSRAWISAEVHGQPPAEHLARCRDLVARGYRPAAISVAAISRPDRLVAASVWHRPTVAPERKDHLDQRQANAAVALLKLGRGEKLWPLLKHSPEPGLRSYVIHRLGSLGADPRAILSRLTEEKEVSSRRALFLTLGEFGRNELPDSEREALMPKLLSVYREDLDPGIHGAVAWLLRQWGQGNKIKEIDESWAQDAPSRAQRFEQIQPDLAKAPANSKPQWYINSQRQSFVVLPGPVEFFMGMPSAEGGAHQRIHRQRIGRSFALSSMLVTREQFERFRSKFSPNRMQQFRDRNSPMVGMTWYEAAEYCNWLSRQEGLPETEWCYQPNPENRYEEGMKPAADYLRRTGYRLPTEAEWEYACRAGAVTRRSYGETDQLLAEYTWYASNSGGRTQPVGYLKPNDWGLFDMYGNAICWCQERYAPYLQGRAGVIAEDQEDTASVSAKDNRVLRGGAFSSVVLDSMRSAQRDGRVPESWHTALGMRLARTIKPP
jgi:formylglycine-generating enzyme required for sulfatase activity